jgi:hypothetical protein
MAIFNFKKSNKVTEFTNSDASVLLASKASGKVIVDRNHADDTAAKAAGLIKGDIYHNAGALRVVIS